MIHLLAQQYGGNGGDGAVGIGVLLVVLLVALIIGIAISILIAWLIYKPYSKLPVEFQQMKPGLIFLLIIPLFNLVWGFFIASQVPASFKSYFESVGDNTVGDAGKNIALAWAICAACSLIPIVGGLAGLASLVLLIIFMVKLWGMAKRVEEVEPRSLAV